MQNIPQPGQVYRHFKGNLYRIVTLAQHSETREILVIYQALYGEFQIYARPLSMFMEKVDKEKYPDEAAELRFTLMKELIEVPTAAVREEEPAKETESPVTEKEKEMSAESEEEINLDPLVIEFLDADTYEKRLNILSALRDRVTDDMINIMAIAVGVEIKEGETEKRYDELRSCLLTFGKYESSRLR